MRFPILLLFLSHTLAGYIASYWLLLVFAAVTRTFDFFASTVRFFPSVSTELCN